MTILRVDRLRTDSEALAASEAFEACREIRRIVFTQGQGVPLDLEFDGLDAVAEHFLAWRTDHTGPAPVGTARLRSIEGRAKAERVAVLEAERGSGVGRALMAAIEACSRGWGLRSIELHAQVEVIPFYERLGYMAHGESFEEAGIQHRSMSKTLEPGSR